MRGLCLALALLIAVLAAAPASAERTLAQYAKACGLAGTPSSVAVDVYLDSAPGSVLATIPNGSVSRVGATDCYLTNLAAVSGIGWPAAGDPTEKHYTLRWRDDASGEVWASESVSGIVGGSPASGRCERATAIYASSPIPSRGITQGVINARSPSYMKIEVACDLDFTAPDATYYEVYYYDSTGRLSKRVPSASVPNP